MDQPQNTNRPQPVKQVDPHAHPAGNGQVPADGPPPPAPPAPPLTPLAWLTQNGIYLVLIALGIIWLYREFGPYGLLHALYVVLGLGFIIFIHELGHFLAAKWCDVHVTTFSIGFGPALPGCSWQRGETTYKLAILPLGGYVNMVGEGPEAEENPDYPRSFKNKSVGRRMLIISAGVLMNVLFGCIFFVVVYRYHGVPRPPAIIGRVEPGSPAWEAGVQPGWVISRIGKNTHPFFDDLMVAVAFSRGPVDFDFRLPDGTTRQLAIEPRRNPGDIAPRVGVAAPSRLQLLDPARKKLHDEKPVLYSSAAAAARPVDLRPGDVVLAASDPDKDGELTPLGRAPGAVAGPAFTVLPPPPGGRSSGIAELCRRMRGLQDKSLKLEVRRAQPAGPTETIEVPAQGFDFGDYIVGTTDPATPDEPFHVKELSSSPNDPDGQTRDPFAFRQTMQQLEGRPAVVQVRRYESAAGDAPVNLLVPPAYHVGFGLRMQMGPVVDIRKDSPADRATKACLTRGDVIRKVTLLPAGGTPEPLPDEALDPVRLPHELRRRVLARPGMSWRVQLTVTGGAAKNQDEKRELEPLEWDPSWERVEEMPLGPHSPVSIPELGIAYRVQNMVVKVQPGSPGARAGIKSQDLVEEVHLHKMGKKKTDLEWGEWLKLTADPEKASDSTGWANFIWGLGYEDFHEVELRVRRGGERLPPMKLTAVPEEDWPQAERGLVLSADQRLQKADTLVQALGFGVERTVGFIQQIYLNLSSMLSGRVSAKSVGGPIEIASQAFTAAGEDFYLFLLFLGIISINLAVVNFLPIPVLDGGHMVFLVYEWVRGRPPSEAVRTIATYIGLALLLALMVFVFYLDISRRNLFVSLLRFFSR